MLSVVPIFLTLILFGEGNTPAESLPHVISIALLLVLVSIGVLLIVHSSVIWGGYQILLEDGEYSRASKAENKRNEPLSAVYWGAVTVGYLAWSFLTNDWHKSWIVWPIAGVCYGLVLSVAKALQNKR